MPVETVLIPVTDDQGGLPRIAVQGDVVGHEAVAQGVLWRALRFDVEERFTVPFPLLILPGNVVRLDEQPARLNACARRWSIWRWVIEKAAAAFS
jgi:hypothetical protein